MRDPGWYWVKYGDQWEIGRWYGMYWVLSVGAENYYIESKVFYDSELSEIDERRITREPEANTKQIVQSSKELLSQTTPEERDLIWQEIKKEREEKESGLGNKLFGLI